METWVLKGSILWHSFKQENVWLINTLKTVIEFVHVSTSNFSNWSFLPVSGGAPPVTWPEDITCRFEKNLIQHLILFLCQIQVNNLLVYLDLDLVLDLDLDLDLDLLPPSSISRILRPSNSSPSSFSKAYSMSLLEKSSISARDSYANLLPNSTMPSPTLGWLVLV